MILLQTFGHLIHYLLEVKDVNFTSKVCDWMRTVANEHGDAWKINRDVVPLLQYPGEVGSNNATNEIGRAPSLTTQGTILEAINVTLNILQLHYMDRDLHRRGKLNRE